jgi:hypothetical protein
VDPEPLLNAQWSELGNLLTNIWIMVIFIVFFALNMLIANNWLTSLTETRHIPPSLRRLRPGFYVVSIASFGCAMYFLSRAVDHAGVLRDFWPNYWI